MKAPSGWQYTQAKHQEHLVCHQVPVHLREVYFKHLFVNMYQNLPLANFRLSEIIPILWANDWARVTAIKSGFPNWKTKKN